MTRREVCLGGTFNALHAGHRLLLQSAFHNADAVYIGLTSDEMAQSKRTAVRSFALRRRSLVSFCTGFQKPFFITMLHDPYGPAVSMASLSAIAVTPDTVFRVPVINRMRCTRGMKPLERIIVPLVRCADGIKLSSSRIVAGECDRDGNVLRRITIGIGSANPAKIKGVEMAFHRYAHVFRNPMFKELDVKSSVSDQPSGDDTVRGAMNRAHRALIGNDIGIGIEAGLFRNRVLHRTFDVQYCVIVDRAGYVSSGHGMGFSYPPSVLKDISEGKTAGHSMSSISGIKDIGRKEGAVGYLTRGAIGRAELTEQAVIAALIPRINRTLYTA
ncbi:MAG: inosine/xanthosine triphosphatase [Thermoplasmata archaeon]|nr:inosine/xanthosine triphosphatase [Candidatus Sysuiplasma acidicola]